MSAETRRIVYERIWAGGGEPVSRHTIAADTGLPLKSLSNTFHLLAKRGAIRPAGRTRGSKGWVPVGEKVTEWYEAGRHPNSMQALYEVAKARRERAARPINTDGGRDLSVAMGYLLPSSRQERGSVV